MRAECLDRWKGIVLMVLLASLGDATAKSIVEPADQVFRGNAIVTLDAAEPVAQAVAIRAGRIVYVGNRNDVAAFIGDRTTIVDLGPRMLMPAFHDAHMHPMSGGIRLLRCSLETISTASSAIAELQSCAHRDSAAWLIVYGLSETLAHDTAFDRHALDRIVADRPLAIGIGPGFSFRVNSAALSRAELDVAAKDASRSDIERDSKTGEATGYVSGDAMMAVRRLWPRPTSDDYRKALREATAMANRFGIVSIFDASVDRAMLDAYHAADGAGELTVRVSAAQRIVPESDVAQIAAMREARDAVRSDHVHADAAKIFVDGEIELHTAALLEPYSEKSDERGPPIDTDAFNALVAQLDRDGFDLHMHVMGDRAVRDGLDAVANAIRINGPRDRRDQLAHDQLIDPADIKRFAALGVIANIQPAWAFYDSVNQDAEQKIGVKRARMLVPFRSVADAGARIVASSDWPSPIMNPLEAIQIAVTRRPLDASGPSWHPEQRLTLMQLLRAYCIDAAWALRLDRVSGSIAVGKSADLIVLDQDLRRLDPMKLHMAHVVLTLLEGKTVYRDATFQPSNINDR